MNISHKRPEDETTQSLAAHLINTANLASCFAKSFRAEKFAYAESKIHDIGKASAEFQRRILQDGPKVDHSTAGAQLLTENLPVWGKLLAYCVAGHHTGMPDAGTAADTAEDATLAGRLKRQLCDYSSYRNEIDLSDCFDFFPLPVRPIGKGGFTLAFFTRMLFSCLVDADYLDTESFMQAGSVSRGIDFSFQEFERQLDCYMEALTALKAENSRNIIGEKRAEIFYRCRTVAAEMPGLFSLTVPTGGGKTLSSLAFALRHAILHRLERIIYVIPYTTIIEQTAGIFERVLGEPYILQHHSNFDFLADDEQTDSLHARLLQQRKLASENWDLPIVITTNVQFFESLFSNRPGRCRKLHNIAKSVIIFDEAQMLPIPYLKPCLMSIAELVKNYGCSAVLCSTTQPELAQFFPTDLPVREICQKPEALYRHFERVRLKFRGEMDVDALAEELKKKQQVLCVVNTKEHARELYQKLGTDSYHLSAGMCPTHRAKVISEIKERLKNGLPCRIISTQLIEAGVDVDFPEVYRAMAGLDSIVQTAGRCNREGKLTFGTVHIFTPEEYFRDKIPPALRLPTSVAEGILKQYEDVLSPQAIAAYFNDLYFYKGEAGLDQKQIHASLEKGIQNNSFDFDFKRICEQFKLIEEDGVPVIIPFDERAEKLIEQLRHTPYYRSRLRSLQKYTVSVHRTTLSQNGTALEWIHGEIPVLADTSYYDGSTGLNFPTATGVGLFF